MKKENIGRFVENYSKNLSMNNVRRSFAIFKMEKAIYIKDLKSLDRAEIKDFDRIYFGEEFCERLIPSELALKKVIKKIRNLKKGFSLVTPPVTDDGLKNIRKLISLLNKNDEIIANDVGVLAVLKKEGFENVVVGRVYGRIVLNTLNSISHSIKLIKEYMLLIGPKIKLIEVDSFNKSNINSMLLNRINFSFREGSFFWTTTRRCAFNNESKPINKFVKCKMECRKNKAVLINTAVNKIFLLEGNKILDNNKLPEKAHFLIFKRIVSEAGDNTKQK